MATAPLELVTGTGRVLLVDDDPDVRATVRLMLEILGYDVVEADGGAAAVALVGGGDVPDAVMLDLHMPGMDGEETLARLHALRPGLPVVVCAGAPPSRGLPVAGFLPKPFTVEEVGRCVAKALGRQ
ncbi:MAG: response regulator [Myxococcota bacterium]